MLRKRKVEVLTTFGGSQPAKRTRFAEIGAWRARRPVSLDIPVEIKGAILEASSAVVALVTYAGGTKFVSTGTIIGCDDVNGTYTSTILTSATRIRQSIESNAAHDDIEIDVYVNLPGGKASKAFKGRVSAHDYHFNIATINITSGVALPTACLKTLDDSISLDISEIPCPGDNEVASKSFQLRRHSNSLKICPGDMVVALGRSYGNAHALMAAVGKVSFECCRFDCSELFWANCIISASGIGGPVMNRHGEVIGVHFYDHECTPFLPINIVSKCLKRFAKNRHACRPWLGMEFTNLYAAHIRKLEIVISQFNIFKGVLVRKVIKGSPAEQAGIVQGDVIVQCGKKIVQGFLEFCDIIWEKVGKYVKVVVVRESCAAPLNLKVFVGETDRVNRWPVPRTHVRSSI